MLKLSNISKIYHTKYKEEVKALDDVSITFPNRGMVFIVGKSGSGKSTLLNIITSLDKPDKGEVIIDNKSMNSFANSDFDDYRNTYIGIIFQEFNLLEQYTVEENLTLVLKMQNKETDQAIINEILSKVELDGLSKRFCNELSGGQRQRLAIARALIKNPKVIIADEPTGNLDSKTSEQIFSLLKKISENHLVIIVSHDIEAADKYSDSTIQLADGRVINTNLKIDENDGSRLSLIKAKLPFIFMLKMALKNFKEKWKWFALTIIISTIAFSIFGTILTVASYDKIDIILKDLYASNTKRIMVGKSPSNPNEYIFDSIPLEDNDYYRLTSTFPNHEFLPVYGTSTSEYSGNDRVEVTLELLQQYDYQLIAGRLPTHEYEYAISKIEYDTMNNAREEPYETYEECFKKSAVCGIIETNYRPEYDANHDKRSTKLHFVDFVIDGYHDTESSQTFNGDVLLYPNQYTLEEWLTLEEKESKEFFSRYEYFDKLNSKIQVKYFDEATLSDDEALITLRTNEIGEINSKVSQMISTFAAENYEKIAGNILLEDQNIINSHYRYAVYISSHLENYYQPQFTYSYFLNMVLEEVKDEYIAQLGSDKCTITMSIANVPNAYFVHLAKVVGFVYVLRDPDLANSSYKVDLIMNGLYLNDTIYEQFIVNSARYTYFVVDLTYNYEQDYRLIKYTYSEQNLKNKWQYMLCDIDKNNKKYCQETSGGLYYTSKMRLTQDIFTVDLFLEEIALQASMALVVLLLFSLSISYIFISFSIANQKKSIGILRSLGVRNKYLYLSYFSESLIVSLISASGALVGGYILFSIFDKVLITRGGFDFSPLNYKFIWQFGCVIFAAFVSAILSSLLPVYRVSKKNPVALIRND